MRPSSCAVRASAQPLLAQRPCIGCHWHPNFNSGGPPKSADQPRGAILSRPNAYTNTLFNNTVVKYANPDEQESQRIGRREMVAWRWATDLASSGLGGELVGRSYLGEIHVGGMFWSHTQYQAPGVSTRDTDTGGRLRNNYTYATSYHVGVTPLVVHTPNDCFGPGCGFFFDADAIAALLIQPVNPAEHLGMRQLLTQPAWLRFSAGRVVAAADFSLDSYNVSSLVDSQLTSMLSSPGFAWLSPVERSDRVRHAGVTTQAVTLTSPWQNGSPIVEITLTAEGTLQAEQPVFPTSEYAPDAREGAHAILSLTDRSVFLIGGWRDGGPTRELWRYDLDSRHWQLLLPFNKPAPVNVLAATYDYRNGRLLVLDEFDIPNEPYDEDNTYYGTSGLLESSSSGELASLSEASLSTMFSSGQRVARLVVHNLRDGVTRVVGAWPRRPVYDRLALVARDDGSFVLLASRPGLTRGWAGTAVGLVTWSGVHDMPNHRLVMQPTQMERGVVAATIEGGQNFRVTELSASLFRRGNGVEEL
jgi:hypothetical protein